MMTMLALLSMVSAADVRRIAVVVGANLAPDGRQRLRFAHEDADHIADALVRVGRFARTDVRLLKDPQPEELLAALDVAADAATPGAHTETMFLFYYSGHADVTALYPHGKRLPLALVKHRLERSNATVRVGLLDACRGGGWTTAKSLAPDAPFDIPMALGLRSQGSVFVSSSSGLEDAHESEALQGSFFTHHLVAGLLGAADVSGDGAVTLNEAYRYAQALTVRDSAMVASQPQHPSFEMHLAGRDDLTLSETRNAPSSLSLEQVTGPLEVIHLGSGVVVLELPAGVRSAKAALPQGRYLVRVRSADGTRGTTVALEAGVSVLVREVDLTLVGAGVLAQKGGQEITAEAKPAGPPRAPDRLGHVTLLAGFGGSADVLAPSAPGFVVAGGAQNGGIVALAVLLRPTERLTLAIGTLAAGYRFGDEGGTEVAISGGLVRFGAGFPRPGGADQFSQAFGVLGVGVDLRAWLRPGSLAMIAGVHAENVFSIGQLGQVVDPYAQKRFTGNDVWQTGGYLGVHLRINDIASFALPIVARMTPLYDGRAPRTEAEWDWAAGLGTSAFGLESTPILRLRVHDHLALDLYAELMIRAAATRGQRLFGQAAAGLTVFF